MGRPKGSKNKKTLAKEVAALRGEDVSKTLPPLKPELAQESTLQPDFVKTAVANNELETSKGE
jgi:hypothetical protein